MGSTTGARTIMMSSRLPLKMRKFGDRVLERSSVDRAIEPSILALAVIRETAEAINTPFLKGVTGILLLILKAVEKAKSNVEACLMLANRAGRTVLAIHRQLSGITISSQFKSNIEQLEDVLKEIQEFVHAQRRVHPFTQILHGATISEHIAMHNKRLDDAIQLFQVETLVTLRARTEQDAMILRRVEAHVEEIQDVVDKTQNSVADFEGIPLLRWDEVNLEQEIHKGCGYRIHTASYQNRVVIAKVFEGARANEDWAFNAKFNHSLRHPYIFQMIGVSSSETEPHAILFHGGASPSHRSIERLIASALRAELGRSVELGIRLIHGLATGLDYLCSQGVFLSSIGLENFDILIGSDDKVKIGFNINSTPPDPAAIRQDPSEAKSRYDEDWEIFNCLCRKTLETANYLLYQERVKREAFSGLPPLLSQPSRGLQEVEDITDPEPEMPEPLPSRIPTRREFVWMARSRGAEESLADVSRRFGEYADVCSSSLAYLRRIVAPRRPAEHNCPGYLREEITLTTTIPDSAIVYHTAPTQQEVCVVCGRIVSCASRPPGGEAPLVLPEANDEAPRIWTRERRAAPVEALRGSIISVRLDDGKQAYRCVMPECTPGAVFTRKSRVISHIRSVHLQEKCFRCKTCYMTFRRKQDADYHVRRRKCRMADNTVSVSECFRGGFLSLVSMKYVSLPDLIRKHDHILEYLSSLVLQ